LLANSDGLSQESMTRTDLLDPRATIDTPIGDSVNIPWQDLHKRSHELPSKEETLRIADVKGGTEALAWLTDSGRNACRTKDFDFGPAGNCRLWSPTAFLEQSVSNLGPGQALDLGCGTGRDAVFLAPLGWEVTAVDILPDALERGRDLAARYSPDGVIEWVQMDLESESLAGQFRLITMFRFYDVEILRKSATLLAPGGTLLVESFSTEHQQATGHPRTSGRAILIQAARDVLPPHCSVKISQNGQMTRLLVKASVPEA